MSRGISLGESSSNLESIRSVLRTGGFSLRQASQLSIRQLSQADSGSIAFAWTINESFLAAGPWPSTP